jgi:Ca-activated chloride channel homolog
MNSHGRKVSDRRLRQRRIGYRLTNVSKLSCNNASPNSERIHRSTAIVGVSAYFDVIGWHRESTAFHPRVPQLRTVAMQRPTSPAFSLIFLLASTLAAQSAPFESQSPASSGLSNSSSQSLFSPPITIAKHVREVNLLFSVTDHKGHFVHGLLPSDLTIVDNGKPQSAVTFFQSETDLPLRVALLIDVSSSITARFKFEKDAIREFLHKVLGPLDSALLIAFNQRVQLLDPASNNWKQLSKDLNKVKAGGETAVYDAVATAAQMLGVAGPGPSRKIIILLTDGEDNSSHVGLQDAINQALLAEANIFAIGTSWGLLTDREEAGAENLKQLAESTGGQYLISNDGDGIARAFNKIHRELRSQYAIGYKPSDITASKPFHRLELFVPHGLRVRCKKGYYTN